MNSAEGELRATFTLPKIEHSQCARIPTVYLVRSAINP